MALLKNDGVVTDDAWTLIRDDAPASAGGHLVLPLARRDELDALELDGRGLFLAPEDDPYALEGTLDGISAIFIDFPKFADGRGYSIARLLRDRFGFTGEIRAVGQVLRDQLFYLKRCGFDAFELVEGKDPDDAILGFEDFSVTYQADAEGRAPIYRQDK